MDEGLTEWNRIAPHLKEQGLLSHMDRAALIAYCQSWARWVQLEQRMQGQPLVGIDANGQVQQNPFLSRIWKEMQHIWKYLAAFGMSPSSRAGLFVEKKPEEQDLWRLFAEKTRALKGKKSAG